MAWDYVADCDTAIAAIQAVLENRATSDIQSYTLPDGRVIRKIPIPHLIAILDKIQKERERLVTAESIADGTGNPRKIKTRFV